MQLLSKLVLTPTCVGLSVPSGFRSELAAEALQLPGGQSSVREAAAFQRGLCHPALCRQGKKILNKKKNKTKNMKNFVAPKSFTGCCVFLCQQVEYQCRGFLEKNRDTLYEELVEVVRVSKVTLSVSSSARCAGFLLSSPSSDRVPGFSVLCFSLPSSPTFSKRRRIEAPSVFEGASKSGRPGLE